MGSIKVTDVRITQYLACGLRQRDDTAYRQRIEPGYEKKVPRW
jgi:glucarate dehydratase